MENCWAANALSVIYWTLSCKDFIVRIELLNGPHNTGVFCQEIRLFQREWPIGINTVSGSERVIAWWTPGRAAQTCSRWFMVSRGCVHTLQTEQFYSNHKGTSSPRQELFSLILLSMISVAGLDSLATSEFNLFYLCIGLVRTVME